MLNRRTYLQSHGNTQVQGRRGRETVPGTQGLLGNSFQPVYARDTPDKRKPGHHHHGLTRAADVTSQLSGPKPLKSMALRTGRTKDMKS